MVDRGNGLMADPGNGGPREWRAGTYVMCPHLVDGRIWGVEPPAKFSTPIHFTSSAPQPQGRLSSPGPGFWPQVVFRNKNTLNSACLLENSKRFSGERT